MDMKDISLTGYNKMTFDALNLLEAINSLNRV